MSPFFFTKLLRTTFFSLSSVGFLSLVILASFILLSPQDVYSASVRLAWEENGQKDVGYRIFYRQGGQEYNYEVPDWEGTETRCTIYGLDDNTTYYFVARAFDSYSESGDSDEVCYRKDNGDTSTVSYIAWEPSSGTIDGLTFEVNKTGDKINHNFQTIVYDGTFMNAPVFLADMQTTDGGDTANVRWQDKDSYGVDVKIAEEQSGDRETNHTTEVVGYMLFSCTDLPPLEIGIEVGEVSVGHDWKWVELSEDFDDPIVVAKSLSSNDGEPAVVRIGHVDATGFEIRVQEWDYLDGIHTEETVGYIVMERGTYTLPDGTMVEAGRFETDMTASFRSVNFSQAFQVAPVVITAVSSYNEPDAVTTRVRNISTNGLKLRMQEQELN